MNATSHARTLELTRKIAQLAVLFRAEFTDAEVDLNPWLTDRVTQCQLDPHSIDLSFYFPKHHLGLHCHCILLQVKFSEALVQRTSQLTQIEAHGFNYSSLQWFFDTYTGNFVGKYPPQKEHQVRFQDFVAKIFTLFDRPM